jgi:hypothetical protein
VSRPTALHTLSAFARVFGPLAIQLRAGDVDEVTIRVYYDTLKDLPLEFLAMAAEEMGRSAEWFPKTSEWRAAARKVETERRRHQKVLLSSLAEPLCRACDDTGWALDATRRAYQCDCRTLRRLELLGVRPWPRMIPATVQPQAEANTDAMMARIRRAVRGVPAVDLVEVGDE